MSRPKVNPAVARLDRLAARMGVQLEELSRNCRRFVLKSGRVIEYLPGGGQGVLRVTASGGDLPLCELTCAPRRVEGMLMSLVD